MAVHPELPGDRLLIGRVKNTDDAELLIDNRNVRVVDRSGRPVRATVRFNVSAAHGLYSNADDIPMTAFERERLGDVARLSPGKSAPLVVAWHATDRGHTPARVELGPATLDVPAGP